MRWIIATLVLSSVLLIGSTTGARNRTRAGHQVNPGAPSGVRDQRGDRALKAFMQRVMMGRMTSCQSDGDCRKPGSSRCVQDRINLCARNSVAALFQSADEQSCSSDGQCGGLAGAKKLAYRCRAGQCDLCGPRICQVDADCCTSANGEAQKCVQLGGFGEKRCWKSCNQKEDCLSRSGSGSTGPGALAHNRMVCIDNVCQKRSRKPKATIKL